MLKNIFTIAAGTAIGIVVGVPLVAFVLLLMFGALVAGAI